MCVCVCVCVCVFVCVFVCVCVFVFRQWISYTTYSSISTTPASIHTHHHHHPRSIHHNR